MKFLNQFTLNIAKINVTVLHAVVYCSLLFLHVCVFLSKRNETKRVCTQEGVCDILPIFSKCYYVMDNEGVSPLKDWLPINNPNTYWRPPQSQWHFLFKYHSWWWIVLSVCLHYGCPDIENYYHNTAWGQCLQQLCREPSQSCGCVYCRITWEWKQRSSDKSLKHSHNVFHSIVKECNVMMQIVIKDIG